MKENRNRKELLCIDESGQIKFTFVDDDMRFFIVSEQILNKYIKAFRELALED